MIKNIKNFIKMKKFNKLSKNIVTQCTWTMEELENQLYYAKKDELIFFDDFMCPCTIKKDAVVDFYNNLKEIVTYGVKPETMNLLDNLNKRITGIINSELYSYIYELQRLML